jgi:hypothetical protein
VRLAARGPRRFGRSAPLTACVALALLAAPLAGCGGTSRGQGGLSPELPSRTATAGDELLPLLPAGAQVIIELDLERARQSESIGALVRTLLDQGGAVATAAAQLSGLGELGGAKASDIHAVIIASYAVGTAEAYTLTLVRPGGGDARALADQLGAVFVEDALDDGLGDGAAGPTGLSVLGPPHLVAEVAKRALARAQKTTENRGPSFGRAARATAELPFALLALRARPMPEGATGAVLRVTAELPFDARLALSRLTNLDPPPARLALWADVADDAAMLIWADSATPDDRKATARLAAALRGAVTELSNDSRVAALGLSASVRNFQLETAGSWTRLTVLIGPQRLARAVRRAELWVKAQSWAKVRAPDTAANPAGSTPDSPAAAPSAGPSSTSSPSSPSKEPP